ncbi:AAA family ATPase [Agromyces sp. Marseille-Q5079]|uniref:AAA family ATPase n=1 Tax=Agromyces sp. Marseille-Q5079 TaxID=3439059 RepID=UPI003D9C9D2D
MRFERVTANAFGALRGAKLDIAPGMTVVHGPNEAGKSTWFAAIYAGLVGRRVSRGRGTKSQSEFRRRHKPWSGAQWKVELVVALDSGRRLVLEQDLQAGRVSIRDAANDRLIDIGRLEQELGRSLRADDSFDGARLLGLDREAVRATLFVGQADVLRVLQSGEELQEHLQRAASSTHLDSTAEEALGWIEAQRRERVGSPHVGAKPLRALTAGLAKARDDVGNALDKRHRLQTAQVELADHLESLHEAERRVSELRSVAEWVAIDELAERIRRARELDASLAAAADEGAPADADTIASVVTAVEAYKARGSQPVQPEGPDAATMRAELEALPAVPDGARTPNPTIVDLARRMNEGVASLETLRGEPLDLPVGQHPDVSPEALRTLATYLEEPAPVLRPGVQDEITSLKAQWELGRAGHDRLRAEFDLARNAYASAQTSYEADLRHYQDRRAAFDLELGAFQADIAAYDRARLARETQRAEYEQSLATVRVAEGSMRRRKRIGFTMLGIGGATIVGAGILFAVGASSLGIILGLIALALLGIGGVFATRKSPAAEVPPPADIDLPSVREQPTVPSPPVPPQPFTAEAPGDAPAPPPQLLDLERELDRWRAAAGEQRDRRSRAEDEITRLGLAADPVALKALARSVDDVAAARSRLDEHTQRVATREHDVAQTASSLLENLGLVVPEVRATELVVLAQGATEKYVAECDERDRLARLAERRSDLIVALEQREQRDAEFARARGLYDGAARQLSDAAVTLGLPDDGSQGLLTRLEAWLSEQRRLAEVRSASMELVGRLEQLLDDETISELEVQLEERQAVAGERPDSVDVAALDELARAQERRAAAADEVANAEGRIREMLATSIPIPPAVEQEARAEQALDDVRELDGYLALAEAHLKIAKERAHADIAPVLAATIRPWVPRITSGRYADVTIDAETLNVAVTPVSGRRTEADVMSQGTSEQIFLLLRIALAMHLSTVDETAPLVLDDVTVQSDQERTVAILDLLHELSADRQVILFTQEPEVVAWANEQLPVAALISL